MKGHARQPNPAKVSLRMGITANYSWMGSNQASRPTEPGRQLSALTPNVRGMLPAGPNATTPSLSRPSVLISRSLLRLAPSGLYVRCSLCWNTLPLADSERAFRTAWMPFPLLPSSLLLCRATPQPCASLITVLIMTHLSPLAPTDSRGWGLMHSFISSTQYRTRQEGVW